MLKNLTKTKIYLKNQTKFYQNSKNDVNLEVHKNHQEKNDEK